MNKVLGLGVVVVAGAAALWYFTQGPGGNAVVTEAPQPAPAASEPAPTAAADAAKAATEAAQAATDAASAAAKAAADAAAEAASKAATAATEAANTASQAGADMLEAAKALTVENFDADKVIEMINTSALAQESKAALAATVEAARSNPDLVADTVAKVKEALGL